MGSSLIHSVDADRVSREQSVSVIIWPDNMTPGHAIKPVHARERSTEKDDSSSVIPETYFKRELGS